MPVSPAELTKLQSEGANSRALNAGGRNPFYASDKMPAATGMQLDEWQARAEAWDAGWQMEDAIREPKETAALLSRLSA